MVLPTTKGGDVAGNVQEAGMRGGFQLPGHPCFVTEDWLSQVFKIQMFL